MATGFDRRQPTRETFAFKPAAPVQVQGRASGQSRGAQIVGGQSIGEGVAAGPQTNAAPVAAGLGQFVEQIMRPHVQRRQQEEFFKGFTRAQEGVALGEITKSSSGMSKIFGPTSYEQGAQFFTAKAALDKWQTDRLAEMDQLKRMTPDDAAKVLSQTSQDMMTGDPFADNLLQQGLMDASGPLMNTVAKARYEYQQVEARNAWQSAGRNGATALQALASAQAKLSAPTDAGNAAFDQQLGNFLGGMAKPDGMSEETYQKGLFDFMRGAMQDGNFYAVEAMRRAGIDRIFGEDDQVKLQSAYDRYGQKVLGKAAMLMAPDLLRLDTDIKMAEVAPDGKGITPMQAAARLADINARLKKNTGIDIDLFDLEDIRGAAGNVTGAILSAYKRAEDRKWQLEDRNQQRQWELEDDAREEAESVAAVQTMWALGTVKSGIAGGMKPGDFDLLAINDYQSGEVKNIANAYVREGWVSGTVGSMMRARVQASIGQQYTEDFKRGHGEWAKLNSVNPSAAKAYYGQMHLGMQRFDQLVKGGASPQMAFARSFGDPAAYSKERVPAERRKGVRKAAEDAIDAGEPWTVGDLTWMPLPKSLARQGITGTPLNESSRRALISAVELNAGVAVSSAPGLSDKDAVRQEFDGLFKSGRAERYGAWAWIGPQAGTVPLGQMLKLKDRDAEAVIAGTIDRKRRAAGFEGNDGHVIRIKDADGKPALIIEGADDDLGKRATVSYAELQQAARERVAGEVRANQPKPARQYNGVNIFRRIPGETSMERFARRQREVAAGADPVNHFNN